MAGLLVIGFICDLLVRAVNKRLHMQPNAEAATDVAADTEAVAVVSQSASA